MNLVIDQGNSLIKLGVFDKNNIIFVDTKDAFDENWIAKVIDDYQINQFIFSSVKKEGEKLFRDIKHFTAKSIYFKSSTKVPFRTNYTTLSTLGKDRLAAVAGAIEHFPNTPVLIIDAGTAITYEFINRDNVYMGGNISPGMLLRYKALNEFTSQLPLQKKTEQQMFIGNSTKSAIIAGVQNGITYEMDSYINQFDHQFKDAKVIITGGDAEFFAGKLKNPIFVNLNLVLEGLNRILKHNA